MTVVQRSSPATLKSKIRLIEVLVMLEIPYQLILGIDFWMAMNIMPDLRQTTRHFSKVASSCEIRVQFKINRLQFFLKW